MRKKISKEINQFLCVPSTPVTRFEKILKHYVQFFNETGLKKNTHKTSWGCLLCLLFAYLLSEKMICHTSFLPSCLSDWLVFLYIIFIWCLLKTCFWKMKISFVDCIWGLIFKTNQFLSYFYLPSRRKKMLLSFWVWLFRFCWACGLE